MNLTNEKAPLFKRIDTFIFQKIDHFKMTPNYNSLLDFYSSLEEEVQKLIKVLILSIIFLTPLLVISFFLWQNSQLKNDLNTRLQILSKANQIIGQKKSLNQIKFNALSQNPIESDSMLTSKLSGLLTNSGVDITKIKVSNFESEQISSELYRTQSNINFTGLSTDELTSLISTLMKKEKFKVADLALTRNSSSNLLQGYIQVIHLAQLASTGIEE